MTVSLFSLVASSGPLSSRGLDDEARDASRVLGMLETGYLVVRADGVIDPAEYENLLVNWREWVQAEVSGSELGDILADLEEDAQRDGLFGRLVFLREVLDLPARRTAFRFAAALAVCDGHLDERESEVLVQVAAAFELSDEEVEATLSAVEDALSAGAEDAELATTNRDSGANHESLRTPPQHLYPQGPRHHGRKGRHARSAGRRLREG